PQEKHRLDQLQLHQEEVPRVGLRAYRYAVDPGVERLRRKQAPERTRDSRYALLQAYRRDGERRGAAMLVLDPETARGRPLEDGVTQRGPPRPIRQEDERPLPLR